MWIYSGIYLFYFYGIYEVTVCNYVGIFWYIFILFLWFISEVTVCNYMYVDIFC